MSESSHPSAGAWSASKPSSSDPDGIGAITVPQIDTITFTIDGRVANLTLDRPAKRNALSQQVQDEMRAALTVLEDRPDVAVLVVAGNGPSFSAGSDLRDAAPSGDDWASRRHLAGGWQRLLDQFDRLPQVTVGRLHGHVVGGAALIAAACAIRVASDDVVVRIPELAIGIPLTWAGIPRLVREVGLPVARDWVITGRAVHADELLRVGYVQRLVSVADLDDAVSQCVREITDMPAGPLAMTRAMFSALDRGHPAMAAGWGDADLLQWSLREPEGRTAAAEYLQRLTDRPGPA